MKISNVNIYFYKLKTELDYRNYNRKVVLRVKNPILKN